MLSKDERPFLLKDVLGQKANLESFKYYSKVEGGTFPDVMLFQGETGTGKTTCARIIAATINCEHPVLNEEGYYEPCGECDSCKSIKSGNWTKDVHFFNASEMKPEDVLKLEEYASTPPWHGGKKSIIIVDEFQELSKKSKGSSLVLFEKTRKDAIFILCTMDAKLDKAVKDRSQTFKFRSLSSDEIYAGLIKMLDKIDPNEKIDIDPKVLILISKTSGGSMRCALQSMERCISGKLYTLEQAEKELNVISEEKAYDLVISLVTKDSLFFTKIKDMDNQSFYNYAWVVLSSLDKTLLEEDPDSWKYKSSKTIRDNPNVKDLIDSFLKIESYSYFKDYIFNYYIGLYLNSKKEIKENSPVTRTVSRTVSRR